MSKNKPLHFIRLIIALFVMSTLVFSWKNVSAGSSAQDVDPNTLVSSDSSWDAAVEEISYSITQPYKGTGKLSAANAVSIPKEELDLPALDGGMSTESVIGPDGRTQILNTTTYPNRAIAWLVITFPNNAMGTCSGWFIGPRSVATAGHCVYSSIDGGWAKAIKIYPGRNGATAPYGVTNKHRLFSVTGWTVSANHEYDYGVIQTKDALGNLVGFFGTSWQSSNTFAGSYTIRGYPGDKTSGTMWSMAGGIPVAQIRKLYYSMDTFGGQSGSPVYKVQNSVCCYGVGVHAYGAMLIGGVPYNSATRITQEVFNNFVTWKKVAFP